MRERDEGIGKQLVKHVGVLEGHFAFDRPAKPQRSAVSLTVVENRANIVGASTLGTRKARNAKHANREFVRHGFEQRCQFEERRRIGNSSTRIPDVGFRFWADLNAHGQVHAIDRQRKVGMRTQRIDFRSGARHRTPRKLIAHKEDTLRDDARCTGRKVLLQFVGNNDLNAQAEFLKPRKKRACPGFDTLAKSSSVLRRTLSRRPRRRWQCSRGARARRCGRGLQKCVKVGAGEPQRTGVRIRHSDAA